MQADWLVQGGVLLGGVLLGGGILGGGNYCWVISVRQYVLQDLLCPSHSTLAQLSTTTCE